MIFESITQKEHCIYYCYSEHLTFKNLRNHIAKQTEVLLVSQREKIENNLLPKQKCQTPTSICKLAKNLAPINKCLFPLLFAISHNLQSSIPTSFTIRITFNMFLIDYINTAMIVVELQLL